MKLKRGEKSLTRGHRFVARQGSAVAGRGGCVYAIRVHTPAESGRAVALQWDPRAIHKTATGHIAAWHLATSSANRARATVLCLVTQVLASCSLGKVRRVEEKKTETSKNKRKRSRRGRRKLMRRKEQTIFFSFPHVHAYVQDPEST